MRHLQIDCPHCAHCAVEERIDKMIADKSALGDQIVGATGENWITEMSSAELTELFTLEL